MDIARLILDYLKVFLSPQVVAGVLALVFFRSFREDIKTLIGRIAKIRFPGGIDLSTSQAERHRELPVSETPAGHVPRGEPVTLPQNLTLTPEQVEQVQQVFQAERARAYLREYRYLNYYLAPHTQSVLDWLASCPTPPQLRLVRYGVDTGNTER